MSSSSSTTLPRLPLTSVSHSPSSLSPLPSRCGSGRRGRLPTLRAAGPKRRRSLPPHLRVAFIVVLSSSDSLPSLVPVLGLGFWPTVFIDEAFTCMPLKKFVITHKPLKKLTAHRCRCSKLLYLTIHSVHVLFVFCRLVWDRLVKLSILPLDGGNRLRFTP